MDAASLRRRAAPPGYLRRIGWSAVWTWLLCFGLVAYLGLKGGGFDPLVHDQIGIAAWWVVLAGVLVGALPARPLGPLAWATLGLLAGFAVWTGLSLTWTESTERTAADLALLTTYAGVFALALFSRGTSHGRRVVGAVAAAIALVALVGLLSRLHPAWFPAAAQTGQLLRSGRERLSYPLDYWNGLAALIAVGLPLLLQIATGAKSVALRGLAAAALPAMGLTIFFTLSRGGIAAAIIALAVFLALASDRLPKLLTMLLAAAGAAVLVAATLQRHALRHGLLDGAAHRQGNTMLAITIGVCLVVGLLQAAISLALRKGMRPRWTFVSHRQSLAGVVACLLLVLIAAVALDAPGRASDAWSEFKRAGGPGHGTERLGSVAGESRYQFWRVAASENSAKPLTGTGSGTFEYWWARKGNGSGMVRDAHSLYMQTLGELGIVGLALLAAFLLAILIGGARRALRAAAEQRAWLAAALAGCTAFVLAAAVDWIWKLPVLPVAMLLLAAALVGGSVDAAGGPMKLPFRLVLALVAAAAIAAIAIPLASTSLLRESEASARAGDLPAALAAARSAQNVQPDAAGPRLQQALVLELRSEFAAAAAAAHAATEREPSNWRTWLVLSRIEAERGRAANAVHDYLEAKSLNPHSVLFQR